MHKPFDKTCRKNSFFYFRKLDWTAGTDLTIAAPTKTKTEEKRDRKTSTSNILSNKFHF